MDKGGRGYLTKDGGREPNRYIFLSSQVSLSLEHRAPSASANADTHTGHSLCLTDLNEAVVREVRQHLVCFSSFPASLSFKLLASHKGGS